MFIIFVLLTTRPVALMSLSIPLLVADEEQEEEEEEEEERELEYSEAEFNFKDYVSRSAAEITIILECSVLETPAVGH